MTGYGRAEIRTDSLNLTVEITSVNRKQSDIVVNLPRDYSAKEIEARKIIANRVSRGRVQAVVRVEQLAAEEGQLLVDHALAQRYAAALRKLSTDLQLVGELSLTELLRAPGIFSNGDAAAKVEENWPMLARGLEEALVNLEESRQREGLHLKEDLEQRLAQLKTLLQGITTAAPSVTIQARENLQKRLAEANLPLPLDDERLVKEIAIFADRSDITEEITRLGGHLTEFARLLAHKEPQGRAMDFLIQEMNRELNTMGAKANHAGIAHLVVAGKTEVERIREQVQNVE